jgi:hypothetical protein
MMSIPTGFTRCETCGELYCTTAPDHLRQDGCRQASDREPGATADTGGIPCPKCGRRNLYYPGLDAASDAVTTLCQWPEFKVALLPSQHGQELWKDPSYQVAVEQARAQSNEPPPDPDEIVDIVIGKNADGEGPFYRVIRLGRLHEPVIFPCGDAINEAFNTDPDFLDYDGMVSLVLDEGKMAFSMEFYSDDPSGLFGVFSIEELAGRFYHLCGASMLWGPYDSLDEAMVETGLQSIYDGSLWDESDCRDPDEVKGKPDYLEFTGEEDD